MKCFQLTEITRNLPAKESLNPMLKPNDDWVNGNPLDLKKESSESSVLSDGTPCWPFGTITISASSLGSTAGKGMVFVN